jgi:UDP-N-acetylenolpyruvoylglucosamine reductase
MNIEPPKKAPSKAAPKAPPKNPDDIPPRNLQDALDEITRKKEEKAPTTKTEMGKMFKKGGKVGSASKRADGCAQRGKTRGKFV